MPYHSSRNEVCTALPAGVASATDAVVTRPTLKPRPRVRRSTSPTYSTRGLSNDVGGVVGVDADLVVVGLVAGDVGRHPRGGIGDRGVQRRGHHQAGHPEGVHRQRRVGLAEGLAARDDPRRRAVGDAHAVADEQDDVPGRPHSGPCRLPGAEPRRPPRRAAPSAVRAVTTWRPACVKRRSRARKLVVAAPAAAAGRPAASVAVPVPPWPRSPDAPGASTLVVVMSRPSSVTTRPAGAADPAPVASTRRSKRCPAANVAPVGGITRSRVCAASGDATETRITDAMIDAQRIRGC